MRFLPTKVHGVLDYLMGIVLIAAPWILGFNNGGAETVIPVMLGVGVILYSLCTTYELGVFNLISMRTHLTIDLVSGLFLAASPWLFGFAETVYLPHLVLGIAETLAALTTHTQPSTINSRMRNTRGSRYHQHAH